MYKNERDRGFWQTFLRLFLPLVVVVTVLAALVMRHDIDYEQARVLERESRTIESAQHYLHRDIIHVVSDLRYLANGPAPSRMSASSFDAIAGRLSKAFTYLIEHNELYHRVDWITPDGVTRLRVGLRDGRAADLDLATEYDLSLPRNRDLGATPNRDAASNSQPRTRVRDEVATQTTRPTLRVAASLTDKESKQYGRIAAQVDVSRLLDDLWSPASDVRPRLAILDSEGYWLMPPDRRAASGVHEADHVSGRTRVDPDVLAQILKSSSGQFSAAQRVWTYAAFAQSDRCGRNQRHRTRLDRCKSADSGSNSGQIIARQAQLVYIGPAVAAGGRGYQCHRCAQSHPGP